MTCNQCPNERTSKTSPLCNRCLTEVLLAAWGDGGRTYQEVSDLTGTPLRTAWRLLRAGGVPESTSRQGVGSSRIPEIVLTDAWLTTPDCGWFVGMLISDGYLARPHPTNPHTSHSVRLSLAEEDLDAVHAWASCLGLPAARVHRNDPRPNFRDSTRLSQPMHTVGLQHPRVQWLSETLRLPAGNKTFTVEMPDQLLHSSHAWRGVLDGDGHYYVARNGSDVRIGLSSWSPVLRQQFADYVEGILGRRPRTHDRGVDVVAGCGDVLRELYSAPGPEMARKRRAADLIRLLRPEGWEPKKRPMGRNALEDVEQWSARLEAGDTLSKVAHDAGLVRRTVRRSVDALRMERGLAPIVLRRLPTDAELTAAQELRAQGQSWSAIGRYLGRDITAIRNRLTHPTEAACLTPEPTPPATAL